MKKKLLSLALACGLVFSLAACGGTGDTTQTPAGGNSESPAPAASGRQISQTSLMPAA